MALLARGPWPRRILWALAAISFTLRLKLADTFLRTPYHEFTMHVNGPDQNRFLAWAETIRSGHWTLPGAAADAPFQFSPVYPWLLSLAIRFQPHPLILIFALQALLSCLAGMAMGSIGRRFGSALGGFAAAVLWLFYAPSIFYDGCLIRESLLASLGLLAFWAAVRTWDKPAWTSAALAGVLLGFGTAIRPHFFSLLLLGCFAAAALRTGQPALRRQRLAAWLILGIAACAVISPITFRNWTVSGKFVPISTQGADALILGNDPEGPGIGHVPTPRSLEMLTASGDRFAGALRVIADQTARFPDQMRQLYARKLRMLVNDYEVPANYSLYVWRLLLKPTRWLFLTWGWVFPFACLGAWAALRHGGRERGWRLVLGAAFAFLAGAAVIHIQSRYRFVAAPFVILLAGYGVAGLWNLLQKKRFIRLIAAIVGIVVIGLAVKPLPSCGYAEVVGIDGVRRLNTDPIQGSDYVTLLVSWSLSGAQTQAGAIRLISRQAVANYGLPVLTYFDAAIRDVYADPGRVLTAAYIKRYNIRPRR